MASKASTVLAQLEELRSMLGKTTLGHATPYAHVALKDSPGSLNSTWQTPQLPFNSTTISSSRATEVSFMCGGRQRGVFPPAVAKGVGGNHQNTTLTRHSHAPHSCDSVWVVPWRQQRRRWTRQWQGKQVSGKRLWQLELGEVEAGRHSREQRQHLSRRHTGSKISRRAFPHSLTHMAVLSLFHSPLFRPPLRHTQLPAEGA